ncbi:MAG: hypothetical protein ABW352_18485 [Polyangiales bacterium]
MKIARFALLLAACSGTDTGNPPVIDFRNSACHDQSYTGDKDAILQSLDEGPLTPDARYKGATCVVSERREDALHVFVSNYEAACAEGVDWKPRVEERSDGGLDLILEDDACQVGRCGTCLYDLDFELPLALSTAQEVHIYQQGCGDQRHEIAAPLDGVACDYTSVGALVFRARGETGERMLCGDGAHGVWGPCDDGLACTEVGTQYGRCLRSCTQDADCDALSACDGSVCKLKSTNLVRVP